MPLSGKPNAIESIRQASSTSYNAAGTAAAKFSRWERLRKFARSTRSPLHRADAHRMIRRPNELAWSRSVASHKFQAGDGLRLARARMTHHGWFVRADRERRFTTKGRRIIMGLTEFRTEIWIFPSTNLIVPILDLNHVVSHIDQREVKCALTG